MFTWKRWGLLPKSLYGLFINYRVSCSILKLVLCNLILFCSSMHLVQSTMSLAQRHQFSGCATRMQLVLWGEAVGRPKEHERSRKHGVWGICTRGLSSPGCRGQSLALPHIL